MLSKIEHVGLEIADLDRSVKFYTEILGLSLVDTADLGDLTIAFLQVGESQVELLCRKERNEAYGRDGSFAHLAFTVDDIDACVAKLRANGVTCTFDSPKEILGGCKIFFFKGPDNETLEFFQPR